jgi:hypothetical protein
MQTKLLLPLYVSCLLLIALTTSSCSSDDDTKSENDGALSVHFTNPSNGQTVSGTVTVTLEAEGTSTPDKIDLYLNDALIKTFTTSPYSFAWNTTALTAGAYRLKAIARDAAGREAQTTVQITVQQQPTETRELLSIPVGANFFGANRPDEGYIVISDAAWNLVAAGKLLNNQTLKLTSDTYKDTDFTVTEIYVKDGKITATSYLHTAATTWTLNDPYLSATPRPSVRLSFNFLLAGASYGLSSNAAFTSPSVYSNTFVDMNNATSRDMDLSTSPGKLFARRIQGGVISFHLYASDAIAVGGAYVVDLSQVNDDDVRYRMQADVVNVPGTNTVIELFGLPVAGDLREAFQIGKYGQFDQTVGIFHPQSEVNPFADYFSITTYDWQNQEIENAGFGMHDLSRLDVQASVQNETTTGLTLTTTGNVDLFEMTFDIGDDLPWTDGTWRVVGPSVTDRIMKTPELPADIQDALAFTNFSAIRSRGPIRFSDYTALDGYDGLLQYIQHSPKGFTSLSDKKEKKRVDVNLQEN